MYKHKMIPVKFAIISAVCLGLATFSFAQLEVPQGKSSNDYIGEAKASVSSISVQAAKAALESDKSTALIDVRPHSEFKSDGYIDNRKSLPAGRLIFDVRMRLPNRNTPIIVYCKKGKRSVLAAHQLAQMGYLNVKYLDGGITTWKNSGYLVIKNPKDGIIDMPKGKSPEEFVNEARAVAGDGISAQQAQKRISSDPKVVILDVATRREHALLGKISNSLVMEQGKVLFNIKKKVHDANAMIIVTCSGGKRAVMTAKMLKEMGYKNVTYINGGLDAWKKAGLSLVKSEN